ncbi:MAG: DUF4838 domain-containing protein, partial [Kiritimatiellae bacterium]|nr:DUF4838 domain-containing protein [Kiritimatiellia bacterium]
MPQYRSTIVPLLCLAMTAQAEVTPGMKWANALKPKGHAAHTLTLSSNGATDYTVVLPMAPSTRDQKAADDLCEWLKAMTGVSFPVVKDGVETNVTGKVISIGGTRLASAAGFSDANLGTEGYAIEVKGDSLFLLGGSLRGPINAVYALLEEDLGCRWYARGTATIPRAQTLRFRPVPRRFVPVLEIRDPYYWDAFDSTWSLRNRTSAPGVAIPEAYGGNLTTIWPYMVHTFRLLVPVDRFFKDHPEYFSENDGKRNPNQLCVTHPEVLQLAIAHVKQVLKANPNGELISVSQNDGAPSCACPACKKITDAEGSPSGPLLLFVNGIADAIAHDFPNVKISTLAYLDTFMPPKTVKPRPNVVIQLCTDSHAWPEPFLAIPETKKFQTAMKGWEAIGASMHIWDYTVNFAHCLAPMPNMQVVAKDIRFFIQHNAKGVMLQGGYWGPGTSDGIMKSWVWAKQLWDPTRDTQALIRDFTRGYYGSAAEPVLEYQHLMWELWERNHKGSLKTPAGGCGYAMDLPIFTRDFLTKSGALFDRARSLATDDETRQRVDMAAMPILYVELSQNLIALIKNGKLDQPERFHALLGRFETVAKREKITHLSEGGTAVTDWLTRLRRVASEDPNASHAFSVPVGGGAVSILRTPARWKFSLDRDNAGVSNRWFASGFNDAAWTGCRTDLDTGWDN